jgi:hypothetical protein
MKLSPFMRPSFLFAAALSLALFSGPVLVADEASSTGSSSSDSSDIDSLFTQPTVAAASTSDSSSLLSQYHAKQDKLSYSFDLYAGGGLFVGYETPTAYKTAATALQAGDYDVAAAGLDHSPVGGFVLTSSMDLRPFYYLRVHGSGVLTYPTVTSSTVSFGASLSELFLDYATMNALSVRFGKYSITWGNARILGVADLPGRTVSTSNVASSVTVLPSWLTATKPAIWLKAATPVGPFSFTALGGLPSNPEDLTLSNTGYGLLSEWVGGKTCIGLSGFYENGYTPRAALTAKTSFFGIDGFVDSTAAWADVDTVLFDVDAGLYYRTSSGPDIALTYELQWNGENIPGLGKLVADAVDIGGLSQALAFSWNKVGNSPFSVGGTFYHDWSDGSGALVPSLAMDLSPSVTCRLVFPFAYGAADSEYITNLPDETDGFSAGIGLVVLLKTSF